MSENYYILTPDGELHHSGVKGMKWGVRNDDKKSSGRKTTHVGDDGTVTKTVKRRNKTTITSKNGDAKAKLTTKRDRGAKLVAKNDNTKVKLIVTNTANITSGALRVAAAFIPGLSVLNGIATATSLVGTVASVKK